MNKELRGIILSTISNIACENTGNCQINLQSKSAQIMVADEITKEVDLYIKDLIEDIVLGQSSLDGIIGKPSN